MLMLPCCRRSEELEKREGLFPALCSCYLLVQDSSQNVYPCYDKVALLGKGEMGRYNGWELS